MPKIEKFEDIQAWQESRKLVSEVYKVTKRGNFAQDYGLRDQVQRSAVSIMVNIAEGYDSYSDEEFIRFLRYGLRSATEVQSHLYVALDQEYIETDIFNCLYKRANKVKSLISGFVRYLKS